MTAFFRNTVPIVGLAKGSIQSNGGGEGANEWIVKRKDCNQLANETHFYQFFPLLLHKPIQHFHLISLFAEPPLYCVG